MKKILLGLAVAFAFATFTAPVARAEGEAAGGDKPADASAKKGKKGKKGKKAEGGEAGGDAAGGDATKK